jgi:hypothetical protein
MDRNGGTDPRPGKAGADARCGCDLRVGPTYLLMSAEKCKPQFESDRLREGGGDGDELQSKSLILAQNERWRRG